MIDKNDVIGPFRGEYRFLSNFYEAEFEYIGRTWPTAEHAYQASKAETMNGFYSVVDTETPGQAKRAGRNIEIRDDWDDVKLHIMFQVCFAKFAQNDDLKQRLLDTGRVTIVELNGWGDTFWGRDEETGEGLNALGQILMDIREVFQAFEVIQEQHRRFF